MTTYVLEMRSTANWQDVRYREYTTSAKKAEIFKDVPRISFTDSGHGIVPHVREHCGHREPRNLLLADHVRDYITAKGREVKRPRHVFVKDEIRNAIIEECARHLEASYPGHAWLNAACAAIRALTVPSQDRGTEA